MSHVLIVEDSPTQAAHIAWLLESDGHDVETAGNGAAALDRFRQGHFDLVLTDIMMPGMSGYALCRAIKSDQGGAHTPVIVVSELTNPQEAEHALECGAEQFIAKPFSDNELVEAVRRSATSTLPRADLARRVLVVEDSRTQAAELSMILEESGFEVEVAYDAERAQERLSEERFHLVLTDLHLPGASGFDLCRNIKSDPTLRDTRVVVLTGREDPANVLRGLSAGADDFMTKGRGADAIIARIRKVLASPKSVRTFEAPPLLTDFLSETFEVRAGRGQILEFLVSAFEDVVHLTRQLKDTGAAISRANVQLEAQVAERRRAEAKARQASRAKSQFLANMSHELRTPLNAIIGYAELIEEEAPLSGAHELCSDARKIRSAARHLLRLVNDILDISKIEAGKSDLFVEPADVQALVNEVAATVQPLIEQNDNRFLLDNPPNGRVEADLTKLRQALYNLLSNAAKFTNAGDISLSVRRAHEGGVDWLVFEVSDTGIGIEPESLETLFRPFAQADGSTTKKYGGTGLGLSISRSYCRMMGGDLTAESTFGQGSTFTIRIPALCTADNAAVVPGANRHTTEPNTPQLGPRRVRAHQVAREE